MQLELFPKYMDWPTDWAGVFGRERPLLLEIGFGGADFLLALAQNRPEANVLGAEISLKSIRKATHKLRHERLTNGRVMQSQAEYLLHFLCAPQSVQETYINFPDPWPKLSHQHRRLINDTFLALLASRMNPTGLLSIATDHAEYATVITECLTNSPYFTNMQPTPFVTTDHERLRTKYELLALQDGRTCHYYKWQRNTTPALRPFPIPEELPMPHIIFQTSHTLPQIAQQFAPYRAESGDTHIGYMAIYQATEHEQLLIDTYIQEAPLAQRVALSIRRQPDGKMIIGLHELGFPRPTPGVQLALAHLLPWLRSLDAQLAVLHHNLSAAEHV
jgi:tRNA (guanine-N7-)-methyltransferase